MTLARQRHRALDHKHQRDAIVLGEILGQHVEPLPPELLTSEIYGADFTPCPRCEASRTPGVIVATRERIFEILGYN